MFFSLRPGLIATTTREACQQDSINNSFLRLRKNNNTTRIISMNVVERNSRAVNFCRLRNANSTLFLKVGLLTGRLCTARVALRVAINFVLRALRGFEEYLRISILRSRLTVHRLVLFALRFHELVILRARKRKRNTSTFRVRVMTRKRRFCRRVDRV